MTALSQALALRLGDDLDAQLNREERDGMRAIVRTAFIDTAACILAGRQDPATTVVRRWAEGPAAVQPGTCSIMFGQQRLPAALAALVNGVAGHALDYDDVGLAGHPSVVLVPLLLAEHERSGLKGSALVQAYAKGYSVWRELQRRIKPSLHARGWHPTAVLGTCGATAALVAARAMSTDPSANALGIAASLASGVVANFGSMTKPLHIGHAAQAAFHAADLAALGMTASPDALDGPTGLLCALVGRSDVVEDPTLTDDFHLALLRHRPGIKKYPVCYAAHRVVDGVLDLVRAHALRLEDVATATATISTTTAGVLRHHRPTSVTEARFSLEFAIAAALRHGRLGLPEVSAATLTDPTVLAFWPHVRIDLTDTRCPLEPSFAITDEVVLSLVDGRTVSSGPIRFARGHAELPLQEPELMDKLYGCVAPGEQPLAESVVRLVDGALAD